MKPSYEYFKKKFLAHECEMAILIEDHVVKLVDAPKISDSAACAYVSIKPKKWTFLSTIHWFFKKNIIYKQIYSSREELINNFKFNGKTVQEIWDQGEPLIEI